MTRRIIIAAICGGVLAPGLAVHAAIRSGVDGAVDTKPRNIPKAVVLPPVNPVPTLRIMNVRLEAPPADAPTPSAVLKFDMLNDGGSKVTDIVIQISMLERPRGEHGLSSRRFVVNPFMIRGSVTLEVGYTMNYEMLLRNLSSDCACVPNVVVIIRATGTRTVLAFRGSTRHRHGQSHPGGDCPPDDAQRARQLPAVARSR